ncbi:MAG: hypothetical protein V4671_26710 [Armatimonadota bacterium]
MRNLFRDRTAVPAPAKEPGITVLCLKHHCRYNSDYGCPVCEADGAYNRVVSERSLRDGLATRRRVPLVVQALPYLLLFCLVVSSADAKPQKARTIKNARITFYCGAWNDDPSRKTASGKPWSGNGVAAGHDIPLGTKIRIEGYPQTFIVDDRGGAVGPGEIDVRRHTRRCSCSRLGVQRKDVKVIRPKKKKEGGRNA